MPLASDIGFTETVKAIQTRKGSRDIYAHVDWRTEITQDLIDCTAKMRSIFVATVNADGHPYIQHRGGPPGFLHVLDKHTIAFADFKGNRQGSTQGNLQDNPRTFVFMIDYLNQRRIKLWGRSEIIEDDPDLLARLMPDREAYRALPEQVFKFTVEAWDINCPQHIPKRVEAEDFVRMVQSKDTEIAALKAEIERPEPKALPEPEGETEAVAEIAAADAAATVAADVAAPDASATSS